MKRLYCSCKEYPQICSANLEKAQTTSETLHERQFPAKAPSSQPDCMLESTCVVASSETSNPRWEDGLLQLDVPKKYMRQFVAEEDASAGKGIPLTADVVQHLTWIGSTVGPVLDEVRKAIHLNSLSMVRAR